MSPSRGENRFPRRRKATPDTGESKTPGRTTSGTVAGERRPACLFCERSVLVLLLVVFALRVWVALAAPLITQESYHWEYSVHPDFSYYDHPPLTGWAIAAGTALLGPGRAGIRLFSLLFALGTTLVGVAMVRDLGGKAREQGTWIVATLGVPILAFGMNLAMTEVPLFFGWMLAAWGLWRARDGALRWWLVTALGVGLALLSKYTAAFLLLGVALLTLALPELRRQLRGPGPWLGLLLAALAFSPVVYWNARHQWSSFLFQATSRYDAPTPENLLESFAGQLVVLTPVIALAIVAATVSWLRRWRSDPRGAFILAFGAPLPLFMAVSSPWVPVKLNWVAPAYPILLIGLLLWAAERRIGAARLSGRTIAAHAMGAAVVVLFVVSPAAAELFPASWGNSWSGWAAVADRAEHWEERLDEESKDENGVFFFSFGVNETAALDYWLRLEHAEPSPLEPVLPESVLGDNGCAFDFWLSPAELEGKNAVAVVIRNEMHDDEAFLGRLVRHFERVEQVDQVEVRMLGVPVQDATIWTCYGYHPPPTAALPVTVSGTRPE